MRRIAGVLMPISSLPSPYGIGTLGSEAYRFVDFLRDAECALWQVLPLQPTSYGDSPYQSCAASALNPYFIDLEFLCREGLLTREECRAVDWGHDPRWVDYGKMYRERIRILRKAFSRYPKKTPEWVAFLEEGKYRDFALFMSLKDEFSGKPYTDWGEYAVYEEERVGEYAEQHREDVEFWQFTQYEFLQQWKKLKAYANTHGIELMGDMPIYVARDSVEMWKYGKDLFLLDERGNPAVQAGVPPDAFSETGQLWGNPIYDWERMKADGYSWWHKRLDDAFALCDVLRIDHFIGFVRYYCIPASATDARSGRWCEGPGTDLFRGYANRRIVAEDLGIVTEEVRAALRKTGFPGMKILQHAFDGNPYNEHKPSNYEENLVAYTGTHDNETLYARISVMSPEEKEILLADLKRECFKAGIPLRLDSDRTICLTILRLLYASRANTVIFPLQDAIRMGKEGRMNRPSTVSPENWSVRFKSSDFSAALKRCLAGMAAMSGRNQNNFRER